VKKTERLLKLITDSTACEYCDGKIYWIKVKNGVKIPMNSSGEIHLKTCPKRERYAKGIQKYEGC